MYIAVLGSRDASFPANGRNLASAQTGGYHVYSGDRKGTSHKPYGKVVSVKLSKSWICFNLWSNQKGTERQDLKKWIDFLLQTFEMDNIRFTLEMYWLVRHCITRGKRVYVNVFACMHECVVHNKGKDLTVYFSLP